MTRTSFNHHPLSYSSPKIDNCFTIKKNVWFYLRVKNKLCTQCGRVTYVPVTQPLIYQRRAKNELTGKKLIY